MQKIKFNCFKSVDNLIKRNIIDSITEIVTEKSKIQYQIGALKIKNKKIIQEVALLYMKLLYLL